MWLIHVRGENSSLSLGSCQILWSIDERGIVVTVVNLTLYFPSLLWGVILFKYGWCRSFPNSEWAVRFLIETALKLMMIVRGEDWIITLGVHNLPSPVNNFASLWGINIIWSLYLAFIWLSLEIKLISLRLIQVYPRLARVANRFPSELMIILQSKLILCCYLDHTWSSLEE